MADKPLTVVARIESKPDCVEQVKQALLAAVAPTHAESACINYDLHQSIDDPCVFVFHENWTSKAALDAHLATPHLAKLRAVLEPLVAEAVSIEMLTMLSTPKRT